MDFIFLKEYIFVPIILLSSNFYENNTALDPLRFHIDPNGTVNTSDSNYPSLYFFNIDLSLIVFIELLVRVYIFR